MFVTRLAANAQARILCKHADLFFNLHLLESHASRISCTLECCAALFYASNQQNLHLSWMLLHQPAADVASALAVAVAAAAT